MLRCAALLSIGIVALSTPAARSAQNDTVTVTIENMQFQPSVVKLRRGGRIVWINKDLFPHTVTAVAKDFDSGSIGADASWSYSASQAGEHPYVCTFHPMMKGKLIVQ